MENFGGNVRFTPRRVYAPADEAELLAILQRHARGRVRAIGALHSWSGAAVSADVAVALNQFREVGVEAGGRRARVGAGCTIGRLLHELRVQHGAALPTVGAITRQTIAGAVATGTHGSGAPSLSDLVESVRVAAYDAVGRARMYEWSGGGALHAARCGLGCTGIVTEVRIRCEPLWQVEERFVPRADLEQVLAEESRFPLQMSLWMPHAWSWLVFQRRRAAAGAGVSRGAPLHRAYSRAYVDLGLHALLRLLTRRGAGHRPVVRELVRVALPAALRRGWRVTDRYDRLLTLRHDWLPHEEMELAVSAGRLHRAATIVRALTDAFADRGAYTHPYPILLRRVLPDRALLSVTGDAIEPWYTISFFSYEPPARRTRFRAFAAVLARELADGCGARPHWGKFFPLDATDIERVYSADRLARFRAFCHGVDPAGVFRNDFTRRVLRL